MRSLFPRAYVAGTALAIVAASIVACFSDRIASATQPGGTATACTLPAGPDVEGSTIVFVHDYAFHPATVRVRRGGRVTWVNCENTAGLSHTTTSEAGWSSGLIAPGAVFTTTLDVAGDFSYHCEPHPFMTGVVVVE